MTATATKRRPDRPAHSDGRPTRSRHVDPTRRSQAVAAWVLALPFCALFLVFTAGPVLASLGMSFTDMRSTDIRNPLGVEFVGLDNYADLVADPLFRKVTLNTLLYLVLGVPLTMAVALAVAVALNRITRLRGVLPGRLLPAGRHQHRGGLGGVEVPAPRRRRAGQHGAGLGRHRRPGLARHHHARAADAGGDGGLAQLRHPDGDLPRRPADHPEGADRGRRDRRRVGLGALPLHHAADAPPDAALRRGDHQHRLPPVLRGGLRDDQGRPARLDPVGHVLHLRPVRVRQLRLRLGRGLPAVPRDRAADLFQFRLLREKD